MDKYEVVIAGTGGQGLIVAGVLLGLAATRHGLYVAQTQEYGVSARGGYCQAEVVINEGEIFYPKTEAPDIVVALSEEAFRKFCGKLKDNALLIYDSDTIAWEGTDQNVVGYGLTSLTRSCGSLRSLNVCTLGVMLAYKKIVPVQVMQDTLADFFRGKNSEKNIEIFKKGIDLVAHSN
ncbi:MAG: 2-oxoacid:acceptor oxidoreductase family protein [Syntrophaceticus sp.]|jgi:2-oxoglutarate ferredoxin oxidoreductase subunit gamma